MKVILVSGQARNGKDVIADYLSKRLNKLYQPIVNYQCIETELHPYWKRMAFAYNVKKVFCDAFEKDLDFVEEWKVKPEFPEGFIKNIRQSLQFIGDGFREIMPTVWIDMAFRGEENRIISDGRYKNEILGSKNHDGFNIFVYRPGFINNDPNGSESYCREIVDKLEGYEGANSQLDIPIDYVICNNGTLEDLFDKIDKFIIPMILNKWPN